MDLWSEWLMGSQLMLITIPGPALLCTGAMGLSPLSGRLLPFLRCCDLQLPGCLLSQCSLFSLLPGPQRGAHHTQLWASAVLTSHLIYKFVLPSQQKGKNGACGSSDLPDMVILDKISSTLGGPDSLCRLKNECRKSPSNISMRFVPFEFWTDESQLWCLYLSLTNCWSDCLFPIFYSECLGYYRFFIEAKVVSYRLAL